MEGNGKLIVVVSEGYRRSDISWALVGTDVEGWEQGTRRCHILVEAVVVAVVVVLLVISGRVGKARGTCVRILSRFVGSVMILVHLLIHSRNIINMFDFGGLGRGSSDAVRV